MHRNACQPGAAEFQVEVRRVAVLVGDVQEDVLAADRVGFDAVELVADGRRDLKPGAAGAHDRVHLSGAQAAGSGVVGTCRTGVRVGAGQDFSRTGQSVLGDDLVTDAVPADVVEALDTELFGELAGVRPAGGVLDGRRGHRVVHHDRQLVGVVNAQRLHPHRRELQIDQHSHVDVHDDGLARGHPSSPALRAKIFSMMVMPMSCPPAVRIGVEGEPLRHPDEVEEFGGPSR